MSNIFLVSDTHFGHANILKFKKKDGTPLREFKDVDHMNEFMIERWNSVVRPQDKVYHLGDVAMNKADLPIIDRCNGQKRLVLGNHDPKDMKLLLPHFKAIYSSRNLNGLLLTHIPVHPESIGKAMGNVHGHVHNNVSDMHFGPQYFNVSVEVIGYTPMSFEDVTRKLRARTSALESRHVCSNPGCPYGEIGICTGENEN